MKRKGIYRLKFNLDTEISNGGEVKNSKSFIRCDKTETFCMQLMN